LEIDMQARFPALLRQRVSPASYAPRRCRPPASAAALRQHCSGSIVRKLQRRL